MKKFYYLLLVSLLFTAMQAVAQDVIVKKDGSTLLTKVTKVGEVEVEYYKWDNQDGPLYTISTNKILSINFENGSRELFEQNNDAATNAITPATGVASAEVNNVTNTSTSTSSSSGSLLKWGYSITESIGSAGISSAMWVGMNVKYIEVGFGFENLNSWDHDDNIWSLYTKFTILPLGDKKFSPYLEAAIGPCLYDGELYAQVGLGIRLGGAKRWRWNIGFAMHSYGYAIEEAFAFKFGCTYVM